MDDMTAFERQVARRFRHHAGPVRPVDDAAIFSAITAASSPGWRVQSMFGAAKFVTAGVVVALFGGFLLVAQPSDRQGPGVPGAVNEASFQPSEAHCRQEPGWSDLVPGCHYLSADGFAGFEVPTSGWAYRPWHGPGGLAPPGSWSVAKGESALDEFALDRDARLDAQIFFISATPDGTYADPCAAVRSQPLHVPTDDGQAILQHSADLVAAMAAIPGIEVLQGPSEVDEPDGGDGDVPANHLVIRIPEDACMPFHLWWDSDLGVRQVTEPGATIRLWIHNHPYIRGSRPGLTARLWIEAETPADADPELEGEIQRIVDSINTPR